MLFFFNLAVNENFHCPSIDQTYLMGWLMDVFGAMRGSEAMLAVVKEECTVRLPDGFDEGGGVMLLALVLLFSSIIATDKYAEDIGSTRTMFVAETKWN